ncbi:MAG: hypothetical protein M3R61_16180 [Chloroflexota bacterium]|nr:hypothetical protein [Chloroflexota bacterium]
MRTLAVGAVAPPVERDGELVAKTHDLSSFSRLADSETLGTWALGEVHRRRIETAGAVGAVVDGALWCQKVIDLHAPAAVRILDFPHAEEYVSAIGHTVGADGPLLDAAAIAALLHDRKHDGPTAVLRRLRDLTDAHPELPDLAKALAYLTQRDAQMQYPTFRVAGWPLGSGSVESANKLVVEDRLKGAEMHWERTNVNPMLAVRNAVCNDRWDAVWGAIEHEPRRQVAVGRRARRRQRTAAPVAAPCRPAAARASASAPPLEPNRTVADAAVTTPVTPQPRSPSRPAADHPWYRAWSVRRQRELALAPEDADAKR